jgi:hypothetical protein
MFSWEGTQAKRVCDACFGGDPFRMQQHALRYVADGHSAVPDLGMAFRDIVLKQNRTSWWGRALQILNTHLATLQKGDVGEPATDKRRLPAWTELAGGKRAWAGWVQVQAHRCVARAKKWAKQHSGANVPTLAEWKNAIWLALCNSDGRARYSRWPLSLAPRPNTPATKRPWENPMWPSVDHLESPVVANVVIETRLVNDMKTILSENELRDVVGHLAHVLAISAKPLADDWRCKRSYGLPQGPNEPPLPK